MSNEKNAKVIQFKPKSSNPTPIKKEANADIIEQEGSKKMITYSDLEERYGSAAAYDLLLVMERLAIKRNAAEAAPEKRLNDVVAILNEANSSSIH